MVHSVTTGRPEISNSVRNTVSHGAGQGGRQNLDCAKKTPIFKPGGNGVHAQAKQAVSITPLIQWPIIGHDAVLRVLEKSLHQGREMGALLFLGPAGVGKATVAQFFARSLLCQSDAQSHGPPYPCWQCGTCTLPTSQLEGNLIVVERSLEWNGIAIDAIRSLQSRVTLRSFLTIPRIILLLGVDACTEEAANALLKLLEEPPPQTRFILTAESQSLIPLTIQSRCHMIRFGPVSPREIAAALHERGGNPEECNIFAIASCGLPGRALRWIAAPEEFRALINRLSSFLSVISEPLADQFAFVHDVMPIETGQEARERILGQCKEWRLALRDAVLVAVGLPHAIAHPPLRKLLERVVTQVSLRRLVVAVRSLEESRSAVEGHVSPRFALEHFFNRLVSS